MYCEELNGCCSVIELIGFNSFTTKETVLNEITNFFDYYYDGKKLIEYPSFFIATTRNDQIAAEKILKELKFTPKKFYGRHVNEEGKRHKYMTLWIKSGLPTGILKLIKQRGTRHDRW